MEQTAMRRILDYYHFYKDLHKFRRVRNIVTWEETISQAKEGEVLVGVYNFRDIPIAIVLEQATFELLREIHYEYQDSYILRLSSIYAISTKDVEIYRV